MREIKFRVWNGEQMISPDYIDRKGFAHWKENSIPEMSDKIMQYTGLKDVNDKEIYEGDIITASAYPFFDEGKANYIATVEWLFSSWQYVLHCVNRKKRGISGGINQLLQCENDINVNFKIIGNIYENPDLLK